MAVPSIVCRGPELGRLVFQLSDDVEHIEQNEHRNWYSKHPKQ